MERWNEDVLNRGIVSFHSSSAANFDALSLLSLVMMLSVVATECPSTGPTAGIALIPPSSCPVFPKRREKGVCGENDEHQAMKSSSLIVMCVVVVAMVCVVVKGEQTMDPIDAINWKCDACKAGVEVIQQFIGDETTTIKKFVHDKCHSLAGKWDPTICPAVDFEVDNLIKLVENKENPQRACQLVKLCPKPPTTDVAGEIITVLPADPTSSVDCPACKMAVRWVQKYIGNESAVIEEYVTKECKAVFGKYAPYVCNTVVAELDEIIKYIDSGLTAEEICLLVGLCQQQQSAADGRIHVQFVCTCCPQRCQRRIIV